MLNPGLAALAASIVVATGAAAQEPPERPTLIVTGRGVAERIPDSFFIGASLTGQGTDQVAALRALADHQARVRDGLDRLEGLTAGTLAAEQVSVQPVYAAGCPAERYERETSNCERTGYVASMRIQFKGAPASRAGDAVSLAAELGAQSVSTTGLEVDDVEGLRAEAARLVFLDARRQADALATASGRRIRGIVRIQDPNARFPDFDSGDADDVVVTGSRIRPTVAIPVTHKPVQVEARLNVIFEIE